MTTAEKDGEDRRYDKRGKTGEIRRCRRGYKAVDKWARCRQRHETRGAPAMTERCGRQGYKTGDKWAPRCGLRAGCCLVHRRRVVGCLGADGDDL